MAKLSRDLTRPRHLAATALVIVLLGGLGAALAGPGTATVQQQTAPATPTFSVPVPRVGDSGIYQLVTDGMSDMEASYATNLAREIRFVWGEGDFGPVPDGSHHWLNRLAVQEVGTDGTLRNTTNLVSPTGVVAYVHESDDAYTYPPREFVVPLPTSESVHTAGVFVQYGTNWTMPCGLRNPFQGATVGLTDAVADPFECWGGPYHGYGGNFSFKASLVGEQAGHTIVAWDETKYWTNELDADPQPQGTPIQRFWMREDLAYPVRIEVPIQGDFEGPGIAYVLSGFQKGTDLIPTTDPLGAPAALPAIERRPIVATTLDDTVIDHPFPLSDALAHAKKDAESGLDPFLADHPNSYMQWAWFASFTVPSGSMETSDQLRWDFAFTDGTDSHAVQITQETRTSASPLASPPAVSYRYGEPTDGPYNDLRAMPRDALPATFPTVASLWTWWEGFHDLDAGPAEDYGFMLGCPETEADEEPCTVPQLITWAGVVHYEDSGTTGLEWILGTQAATWTNSQLRWIGDDLYLTEMVSDHGGGLDTPVDAPRVPGASEVPPEGKAVPRRSPATVLSETLTPVEVASVGAAALLAGLAYWLWPALKAGGVGLFSRVAIEDLLQNPQRARIVQIVEAEVGIHHRELERRAGLGKGALDHHLRKLVAGGLLLSHRGPGYTCYFPKRTGSAAMRAAPALKSDTAQALLELVRRKPGVTLSEAALTLGVAVGTIHHHTKRMTTAGVLTSMRQGASVRLTATTAGTPAAAAS